MSGGENEIPIQGLQGESDEEIVTICDEDELQIQANAEGQVDVEEVSVQKSKDSLDMQDGAVVQNDENNNHLHNQVADNITEHTVVEHEQSPQDMKMYENQLFEETQEYVGNQEFHDHPTAQHADAQNEHLEGDEENFQNKENVESMQSSEHENAAQTDVQNDQEQQNYQQNVEQVEKAMNEKDEEAQDEMELVMEMDSGGEDSNERGAGIKVQQVQRQDDSMGMDIDDDNDEEIVQLNDGDNFDDQMQVDDESNKEQQQGQEYTFQDNQGDELLDEELTDQKQKHIAGHDFDGDIELDYEDYDETEHHQHDNTDQTKQQQKDAEKQSSEKQEIKKPDETKSKQRRSGEPRKRAYSPIPLPTPSSSAPSKEVLPGGIKISRKGDHVRTVRPLSGHQLEKLKVSLPLGNLESNLPTKMQRQPLSRSSRDKSLRKLGARKVWQMRDQPKNQDIRVKIWQSDENSQYLQTARTKLIIDPCEQDEKYDEGLKTAQRVLTKETIQHLQYGVVRRVRAQVFRELTQKDTSKMRDPNPYVLAMARKIGDPKKIGLDEIQKDKYYDLGCCRLMSLVSKQLQQKLNKISKSKRYEVIREFGSLDSGMVADVPDWWLIGFMYDRAEQEVIEMLPVRDGPRLVPKEMKKEIEEIRKQLKLKQQQQQQKASEQLPIRPSSAKGSSMQGQGQAQQSSKGIRPQDTSGFSKNTSKPPFPISKSLSNEKVKIPGRNQPIVDSGKRDELVDFRKREPIPALRGSPSSKGQQLPSRGGPAMVRGQQPPPPRNPIVPPKVRVVQSGGSRGVGPPPDLRMSNSRQLDNLNEASREREREGRSRGRGVGRSRSPPPRGGGPSYPPGRPVSPPRRRVEKRRDRSLSPPKPVRRKVERQEDIQPVASGRMNSRGRRSPPRMRSGRRSRSRSPRRRPPGDSWQPDISGRGGGAGSAEPRGGPLYGYGTQPSSQPFQVEPMKSNIAPGFSINDLQNGMQQQFNQGRAPVQQTPIPNNSGNNLLLQQLQQQLQPLGLDQATMNSILALATQQQQSQAYNNMLGGQQQQQQRPQQTSFMQNSQQMGQLPMLQAQLQNQIPQQQQNILQNILNAATKNQSQNNAAAGFGSQNLLPSTQNNQQQQQYPAFSNSGTVNNANIAPQVMPQQVSSSSSGTQVRVVVGGTRAADPIRQKWQHDVLRKDNEDAFKIGRFAFGVADGLGGTAVEQGVSSAGYAMEMVELSVKGLEEMAVSAYQNSNDFPSLTTAIEYAYSQNSKSGATTINLLAFDCLRSMLHVARVGDSGYVVLRPLHNSDDMLIVSPWKPYQESTDHIRGLNTTTYLASPDLQPRISGVNPNRAAKTNLQVRSGDIVIAATDGFFDAIFIHGKEGQSMRQRIRKRAIAQQCDPGLLAEELATAALQVSMAHVRKECPYNLESRKRKEGRELKADDVAIVVAYVLQA